MDFAPSSGAPAHNVFTFNGVTFSSNFDNGNLLRVEQVPNKPHDFRIWTAPDNTGTSYQSKHCAWFFFVVTGLPQGCVLRIQIVNASNHSGLYKYDMVSSNINKYTVSACIQRSSSFSMILFRLFDTFPLHPVAPCVSKQHNQSKVDAHQELGTFFQGAYRIRPTLF